MRRMTEDFIGTCQWCLGEYKVNARKVVVLHGFERPGYGHTVGRCSGEGHAPLEYDHKLLDENIDFRRDNIDQLSQKITNIDSGKINRIPNPAYVPLEKRMKNGYYGDTADLEFLQSDHKDFPRVLKIWRANIENEKRFLERMLAHFIAVREAWAPGKIVGIDTPATGKERYVKNAYNPDEEAQRAEYLAAKAIRDAKPGKIAVTIATILNFPPNMAADEDTWRKGYEQIHAQEDAFKKKVKAWAKAAFPNGKLWVGESYSGDAERFLKIKLSEGARVYAITVRPDWSYCDDVMAMFPGAARYDKDTNRRDEFGNGIGKGKQIALWVFDDAVPFNLTEGKISDYVKNAAYASAAALAATGANSAINPPEAGEPVSRMEIPNASIYYGDTDRFENEYSSDETDEKIDHQSTKQNTKKTKSYLNSDQGLLALTMWGEARSHGVPGMRAVGHVIMNRLRSERNFGGASIKGTVWKRKAFSCWNKGDPNREAMLNIRKLDKDSPEYLRWRQAWVIAGQILTGESHDPTRGALFYHTAAIKPVWAKHQKPVAKVADHIFYKDDHKV